MQEEWQLHDTQKIDHCGSIHIHNDGFWTITSLINDMGIMM
jgi:hypothetical protein